MIVKVKEQSQDELRKARAKFISVLTEIIIKYENEQKENGAQGKEEDQE